jgi:hypothetical protein
LHRCMYVLLHHGQVTTENERRISINKDVLLLTQCMFTKKTTFSIRCEQRLNHEAKYVCRTRVENYDQHPHDT